MQSCTLEALSGHPSASAWGARWDWPLRELLAPDFRVDRRSAARWPVAGTATLLALGSGLGVVVEIDSLEGSPWWLSGFTSTPIEPGTRVSVGFSDPHGRPASGVVERCRATPRAQSGGADGGRFQVAIRFVNEQLL